MNVQVQDFKWENGKNDSKYIELLEKTVERWETINGQALNKIWSLAVENKNIRNKTIDEFADAVIAELKELDCEAWRRDIRQIAERMKKMEDSHE